MGSRPCLAAALLGVLAGAAPATMRAGTLSKRSSDMRTNLADISVTEQPVPSPSAGQVLLRVSASSVNPVDLKIVETPLTAFWRMPHVLGFDVSGTVAALGPHTSGRLKVGDAVYAEVGSLGEAAVGGHTWAEYAVADEWVLGLKPRGLNMTEAGALPMVGLTSLMALRWGAGPSQRLDNQTVLVLGGSGGTGHVGIQIAKALGAREVITTCGTSHLEFVMALGADRAIDYHKENWYDVLPDRSINYIYDCVGQAGTGAQAYKKLAHAGRFVTLLPSGLAGPESMLKRLDLRQNAPTCIGSCVAHENIDALSEMVDAGQLRVVLDHIYPLDEVQRACNASVAGHSTGKVAINIGAEEVSPFVV